MQKKFTKENAPKDMNEFLAGMLDFMQSFNRLRQKLNMDENLAFLLNKADSPDERLKANQTIRIMTDMEKIGNIVQYLNKPVKIEGILQRKLDGTVRLNEIPLNDGSMIEYLYGNQWNIGILKRDPSTRQYGIYDENGKIVISKIEQIETRIR